VEVCDRGEGFLLDFLEKFVLKIIFAHFNPELLGAL
jgi:hypothetical protein